MDKNNKELSLIMPVYHEGEAVIPVIATLFLTVHYPFKLYVVYDSPDDKTIVTIGKLQQYFKDIYLVQNEWKKGVLNALKTGLKHADTKYIGIWISYHVDPFGVLNQMLEKLEDGFDLVSANRFTVESSRARGNAIKKMFSYIGNLVLHKFIGMPISDVTTSIKVYRKSLLDDLTIDTVVNSGWAVSTELAIKAAIRGYRLVDIPLEKKNINLIHGITNFKVFRQLPEYFRWMYLGVKNRKSIKENFNKVK
jgi:glycosyltransferase involved in cell wall biosynthesis